MIIRSSKSNFKEKFNAQIVEKILPAIPDNNQPAIKYFDFDQEVTIPEDLSDYIERIFIEKPGYSTSSDNFEVKSTPPEVEYYTLQVEEIASILGADRYHASGITGEGVKVVMIDTGFYEDHPYYQEKNYKVNVRPINPDWDSKEDLDGHGTAIAANLLAIAPKIDLTMVKIRQTYMDNGYHLGGLFVLEGFITAFDEEPDIISSSCVIEEHRLDEVIPDLEQRRLYEVEILNALRKGTIIFCAAGNTGVIRWPSTHPEIICVGGVYPEPIDTTSQSYSSLSQFNLKASNYASSGSSGIYSGRYIPDICGFVGMKPHGALIKLPVCPYSEMDYRISGVDNVDARSRDGTLSGDGWVVASGTSSATPQVAGVAALLVQQYKQSLDLSGLDLVMAVKARLLSSAIDITEGESANGNKAVDQFDLATGWGLVNALSTFSLHSAHVEVVPTTIGVGQSVLIKGSVVPKPNKIYSDYYRDFEFTITLPDGGKRAKVMDSDINGEISFEYTCDQVGKYGVELHWDGDAYSLPSDSLKVDWTVQEEPV